MIYSDLLLRVMIYVRTLAFPWKARTAFVLHIFNGINTKPHYYRAIMLRTRGALMIS